MSVNQQLVLKVLIVIAVLFFYSCSGKKEKEPAADARVLKIDGSSTVYPITAGIIERYKQEFDNLKFDIAVSGTGGGFKKFVQKETDINNASRSIKGGEEELCENNGIAYTEYEIAYDGIAIVMNQENDWVDNLTVEELNRIWVTDGVTNWSDIKPGWPEEPIKLYGPGDESGTHDYFMSAIIPDTLSMRDDYVKSENDNLLVTGISNNKHSLGFFGLAYFEKNKDDLKLVPIDNGDGPVLPTPETVGSGKYKPLARPLFIYVNDDFGNSEDGKTFINFYFQNVGEIANQVGYVSLPPNNYQSYMSSL
ncbi:MAG TPA: PstS family phosphate ABC transporter substrate-binding protein [Cyclobacteriaceae bacterium]